MITGIGGTTMTDEEMLLTLIHIKRHIISKPIKAFIDTRIKLIQKHKKALAMSYHISYTMPLYGQKNSLNVDVIV